MRDFRSIYTIILVFSLFSCQQEKSTNADTQFGKIRDAKGYYNEGDKKFKIFEGGVFRTNETRYLLISVSNVSLPLRSPPSPPPLNNNIVGIPLTPYFFQHDELRL